MSKSLLNNVVFLDFETTGLKPEEGAEIIEIGAIKIKDNQYTEYHQFVKPIGEIPEVIFNICKGLKEDVEKIYSAPAIEVVKGGLLQFIEDLPLICHNAAFEKMFIRKYIDPYMEEERDFLDSCELACLLEPQFSHHNLNYLKQQLFYTEEVESHRAVADCYDAIGVVNQLIYRQSKKRLQGITDYLGEDWLWGKYLQKDIRFYEVNEYHFGGNNLKSDLYINEEKLNELYVESANEKNLQKKMALQYLKNWQNNCKSRSLKEISYWFIRNNPYVDELMTELVCKRNDCE